MDIWDLDKLIDRADKFRERYGRARASKVMSMDSFSLHCGLSAAHYRMIKGRERKKPDNDTIEKICLAIEESPAEFISEDFMKEILNYIFSKIQRKEQLMPAKESGEASKKKSPQTTKEAKGM